MDTITATVDAKGQSCPGPLVSLAKAMKEAKSGDLFELLATDPGSKSDVPSWAELSGNAVFENVRLLTYSSPYTLLELACEGRVVPITAGLNNYRPFIIANDRVKSIKVSKARMPMQTPVEMAV